MSPDGRGENREAEMGHEKLSRNGSGRRSVRTLLILAGLAAAVPAGAAPPVELASGLSGAIGVAHDAIHARLYFVEYGAGTLKRIRLIPGCDLVMPVTCPIDTVAAGFTHPEDVALDVAGNTGYVTTRDDPGTTGALWRVNLTTGVKSLVTFNLGAPHQIVLDVPTNSAYVVGFTSGKLWQIDLTTGVKVPRMLGLGNPVGLAVKADRTRAFVTEQAPARLAEIDLMTGVRVRNVVGGLTSPFFLAWTDPAQIALYLVERDPANRVSWVDLTAATKTPVITPLPFRPSGIAVDLPGGAAFVTTDAKVLKASLAGLPMGEPVFLGVGHVPSTSITDGYATTAPGYFFQVKHAPFGGTLNIFGNLSNFKALGATHYRVLVAKGGGMPVPLKLSWNTYKWNTVTSVYDLVSVAPLPTDDRYEIPAEYPALAYRWYPPFLMMQWPSGDNDLYTFSVQILSLSGGVWTDLTGLLPAGKNSLTVLVDNTPATVNLVAIRQHGSGTTVKPCDIVSAGTHTFDFQVTASDPNHHLLSYSLTAYWGKDKSAAVFPAETYAPGHVDAEGPYLWSGVTGTWLPAAGWTASCNCAHTFFLESWKRTIDGYNYLLYGHSQQSVTINNTGVACP